MLNLIKLCVGTETVDDLARWQDQHARSPGSSAVHVTRMWPKRESELVDGGSLYWVIKGVVLARQRIVGLEPRDGEDGIRRCAIQLDPEIVRTAPQSRRPFQGWRYLRAADAPRDLGTATERAHLPPALMAGLDALGVL